MRVLVTGHDGYIGRVLVPLLSAAGHDVWGLNSYLFEGCVFGDDSAPQPTTVLRKDVRDVVPADLDGCENYQVRDVAELVGRVVPDSVVSVSDQAFVDLRNYRVDCNKIADVLGFETIWTVEAGIMELFAAYQGQNLSLDDLEGSHFMRIQRVRELLETNRLSPDLRWQS